MKILAHLITIIIFCVAAVPMYSMFFLAISISYLCSMYMGIFNCIKYVLGVDNPFECDYTVSDSVEELEKYDER